MQLWYVKMNMILLVVDIIFIFPCRNIAFDVMNVVWRTKSEADFCLTSYNNKTYRMDSVVFEKHSSYLIPGPATTNYENKTKKKLTNNWNDRKVLRQGASERVIRKNKVSSPGDDYTRPPSYELVDGSRASSGNPRNLSLFIFKYQFN